MNFKFFSIITLCLVAFATFLASCVITLTDGQGALVFIISIPIMYAMLVLAFFINQNSKNQPQNQARIDWLPKSLAIFFTVFFIFAFIPGLRRIPNSFMNLVGMSFTYVTGKSPRDFFKDRASFENKLSNAIKSKNTVSFLKLDLTFAWDKVCIFGPYTNNAKAQSILKLNWNIEERSQIQHSDSINTLVFLFEGRVNQVVDLRRGIADFKDLDVCLSASQTVYDVSTDANGLIQLSIKN